MNQEHIIALLSGLLLFNQCVTLYMVNKLVNKVMSRNFAEYTQSKEYKPKINAPNGFKIPTEPQEDLGPMGEFGHA